MKKIIILLAVTAAILILTSCAVKAPQDDVTTSGEPETSAPEPEEPAEKTLDIIATDGTTAFMVLRSDKAPSTIITAVGNFTSALKAKGCAIIPTTDWVKNPQRSDFEIVVGETLREGNELPAYDRALLGDDGYIIEVVGTRVAVIGGSETATVKALEYFATLIKQGEKFSLPENYRYAHSESAEFDGVKVNGISLSEFTIESSDDALVAAGCKKLIGEVFAHSGVFVSYGDAEHKITVTKDSPDGKFVFEVSGGNVKVSGNERIGISRGIRDMFEDLDAGKTTFETKDGILTLKDGDRYEKDYGTIVLYEDFGAKGDGKTDDIDAIVKAHDYANEKRLPVFAKEDATYYIGGGAKTATVKTSVDWSEAHFIFDDTSVENRSKEIFLVNCENALVDVTNQVSSLKAGQKNIGITLPGDAIVTAINSGVKQYIRYGSNQNDGAAMTDVILVHANGDVDESTPILWNFDAVTSLKYRLIETEPLTVKGGTITTIANAESSNYNYYYRGIRIYRSNVVFDGLTHLVDREGSHGAPYYGILIFNGSVGSEVKNCVLTGHKTYKTIGAAGTSVSMGTYDITVTNSLGFKMTNTVQTNDINDSAYWGVFASNYSKNIVFDGCRVSRFDAHAGVYNVTLLNCALGHQGINLIGHGTARIENTTVYSTYFVNLRSDYGSTWDGDLVIKDCTYIPKNGAKCDAVLIGGSYTDGHDFGYVCHLPAHITIDGLYVKDSNPSTSNGPMLFANINSNFTSATYVEKYPLVKTESVTVKNFSSASGKTLGLSINKYMFGSLEIKFE